MTFKNKTFIGLAFVLSFAVVSTVFGEEYPNIGIVYGTKDNDSLTYDCNKKSEKIITCNFIHTSIRAELEKEKIASEIQKEMKYFDLKRCERDRDFFKTLPKLIKGEGLTKDGKQVKDTRFFKAANITGEIEQYKLLLNFCRKPTKHNYRKFLRSGATLKTKTCRVATKQFRHDFTYSESGDWIVIAKPYGSCGSIRLDRFEKASTFAWNYISRKAVTNPNGKSGAIPCSKLDEGTYFYSWIEQPLVIECRKLKFTNF